MSALAYDIVQLILLLEEVLEMECTGGAAAQTAHVKTAVVLLGRQHLSSQTSPERPMQYKL